MSGPLSRLTTEQEAMMLELMTNTFGIPEGRARSYILRFREMALEAEGDALLAHGDRMDPHMAKRALTAFLERVRVMDQEFREAEQYE